MKIKGITQGLQTDSFQGGAVDVYSCSVQDRKFGCRLWKAGRQSQDLSLKDSGLSTPLFSFEKSGVEKLKCPPSLLSTIWRNE